MMRTAQFTVLILKTAYGYEAVCPAFPHLSAKATSARVAYARCKQQLKASASALLAAGKPVPRDPVVQSRTLRLDLWYLLEAEDLR